jgi:hypothetical protein
VGRYTFRFFANGKIVAREERELEGDLDALELAQAWSERGQVEVWRDGRYVARVKKDDAPISAKDRLGG